MQFKNRQIDIKKNTDFERTIFPIFYFLSNYIRLKYNRTID